MRVLVACEMSGIVRDAFLSLGHDAVSCDLLPSERPGPHIQGDVVPLLTQEWDMLLAFPPCFAAGTLVLCADGYKLIESVQPGDMVLTHLGRWRRVSMRMTHVAEATVVLRVTGSAPIRTTEDHPFLCIPRSARRRSDWPVHAPRSWIPVRELNPRVLVGFVLPPTEPAEIPDDILWLMGRYVADGYMRIRRGQAEEMTICVGKHKIKTFMEHAAPSRVDEVRTSYKAMFYRSAFVSQFRQFGRGAENKRLPGWVLTLPPDQSAMFLEGYMSGDGHYGALRTSANSVSKELAVGIALLMRRCYGRTASVHYGTRKPQTVIEGRVVNQKNSWRTHVRSSAGGISVALYDGDWSWNRILRKTPDGPATVFNLSVEEDESYTVEGCVVHNCTYLANSGARWWKQRQQEQADALAFVQTLLEAPIPRICLENPEGRISTAIRKPDQLIHPWEYGEPEEKKTCLWLKNLPLLQPTRLMAKREQKVWRMGESKARRTNRSRTYVGIATAMALQWNF